MYLKGLKHLGMSLLGPLVCKRRFAAARSTQESASKQSYFAQTLLLLLCFQRATASSTGLYEEIDTEEAGLILFMPPFFPPNVSS